MKRFIPITRNLQLLMAVGVSFFSISAMAQKHEVENVQEVKYKNELSIDVSPLLNQVASTGILYKRQLWGEVALRTRVGGSYIQDNENIATGTLQVTTSGITGALGLEHAYHIGKFEFIYGIDALLNQSQIKTKASGEPPIDQTTQELGIVPVVGLSYHPAPSIVLGIEPEAFVGTVSRTAHNGEELESSKETEIMLIKGVSFYVGLKF